jgi:hypothetical protein
MDSPKLGREKSTRFREFCQWLSAHGIDRLGAIAQHDGGGGFAGEDRAELLKVERMLRTCVATEPGSSS